MRGLEDLLIKLDRSGVFRGGVMVAALLICIMPQLRYAALHTAFYDLGQYVTNYMLATREGFEGIMLRGHAHLLMPAFVPIFRLLPSVETLLALQSCILLSGIWLYACLWTKLNVESAEEDFIRGYWSAWSAALVCVLSLSIWSSALFDYHFEHLLVPLYILFFWQLESNSKWQGVGLIVLALLIAMTKEVYALTSIGLGLYLVLSRNRVWIGCAIILLSSAYFVWMTMYVIPTFSDGLNSGDLWRHAFGYLGRSPFEMLANLVTEPRRLIDAHVLTMGKLIYVCALLGPFMLVLWRLPLMLVPALPSLAIAMLSLEPNHSYLVNQYSVSVTMPLLIALLYAMAGRWDRLRISFKEDALPKQTQRRMLAVTVSGSMVCLLVFSPGPLSRLFWKAEAWSYHYSAYWPTDRDRRVVHLIEQYVPSDPDLAVSMQNTLHTGRLSLRYHALGFPQGVFEPAPMLGAAAKRHQAVTGLEAPEGMIMVDYVVLDHQRPAYFNDRPVARTTGQETSEDLRLMYGLYALLPNEFDRIVEEDGFEIWKRKASSSSH